MKNFLPVLFILIAFTSKAQFLNIPDPVFKAHLIQHYDLNFNNEIDLTEIPAITYIEPLPGTKSLEGINSLTNLITVQCDNTQIDSLEVSGLTNLVTLGFSNNDSLKVVEINNAPLLDKLIIKSSPKLAKVNLASLPVLRELDLWYGFPILSSLDLSTCPSLRFIGLVGAIPLLTASTLNLNGLNNVTNFQYVATANLPSVNLNLLPNLKTLICGGFGNFIITGHPTLSDITYGTAGPGTLTVNNSPSLNQLKIVGSGSDKLTALTVGPGLPSFQTLDCKQQSLTSLDLTNCPNLSMVECRENQITNLNVTGLTHLKTLNCLFNNLGTLDVSSCDSLDFLYAYQDNLTSLNVNGAHLLTSLACNGNMLTTLDVSDCPALKELNCNGNLITTLDLKNGPTVFDPAYFNVNQNPLKYVCIDDAEANFMQTYFAYDPHISVNSYCSFVPGGAYNIISGKITGDLDNNGCDAADPALQNMIVKIDDGTNVGYTNTNAQGQYTFFTNAGNFTVTPQITNPYFAYSPVSSPVSFSTAGGNSQTVNFCSAKTGVHPDVEITIVPFLAAVPGISASYQLIYKNKGTETVSGNIEMNFNDDKLDFLGAAPTITSQATGVLNWSYSNLAPFETRTINVVYNLLPPPDNTVGDTLTFVSNITPVDETPLDNTFTLKQVVRGSFDPNDKTCLDGSNIDITKVGDYINYLIRFQNTGTAPAMNIVVKDILSDKFNWNSFEIIKTSHPCVLRQTSGNNLEFIFENINLPDSNTNEPASHGFIAFKVKTIGTLSIGDSLKNNAAIYFDFNLPVVTNTAASVIDSAIIIPITIEYFKGSIQAGKHLLNWKADCTSTEAKFSIERSTDGRNFISLGNITASNTRCLQPFDFTDNNPAAGINYYRIKMTDIDGKTSFSAVIALLNKKTGFEIVNLVPNPVTDGTASLNITSAEKQIINIKITDASGKIVQSMDQPVISGFTQLNMNFNKLAAGTYTIIVYTNDGERKTKQFIKQ